MASTKAIETVIGASAHSSNHEQQNASFELAPEGRARRPIRAHNATNDASSSRLDPQGIRGCRIKPRQISGPWKLFPGIERCSHRPSFREVNYPAEGLSPVPYNDYRGGERRASSHPSARWRYLSPAPWEGKALRFTCHAGHGSLPRRGHQGAPRPTLHIQQPRCPLDRALPRPAHTHSPHGRTEEMGLRRRIST